MVPDAHCSKIIVNQCYNTAQFYPQGSHVRRDLVRGCADQCSHPTSQAVISHSRQSRGHIVHEPIVLYSPYIIHHALNNSVILQCNKRDRLYIIYHWTKVTPDLVIVIEGHNSWPLVSFRHKPRPSCRLRKYASGDEWGKHLNMVLKERRFIRLGRYYPARFYAWRRKLQCIK